MHGSAWPGWRHPGGTVTLGISTRIHIDPMNSNADLLKELRIDRSARQAPPPRRGLWIGVAIAIAVVALLALGGW